MLKTIHRIICWLLLVAMLIPVPRVTGQGGFFPEKPLSLTRARVLFAVDREAGRITAIFDARVFNGGYDTPFTWLLPIPADADVSFDAYGMPYERALGELDRITLPRFEYPPAPCASVFEVWNYGSGCSDCNASRVQHYDRITAGSAAQALADLRELGYDLPDDQATNIAHYINEGMDLLVIQLDGWYWLDTPITLNYAGDTPVIPILLNSGAVHGGTVFTVWILADTRYVSGNYLSDEIDPRGLRSPGELKDKDQSGPMTDYSVRSYDQHWEPYRSYFQALRQVQAGHDEPVFFTEYAQSTATLLADNASFAGRLDHVPFFQNLLLDSAYITRLTALFDWRSAEFDPVFVPDTELVNVAETIDLTGLDPLQYWGCSTQAYFSADFWAKVPDALTRIDTLPLATVHPTGWQLSTFTFNDQPVWALAPEPVNAADLMAVLDGTADGPIFVMLRGEIESIGWYPDVRSEFQHKLGLSPESELPGGDHRSFGIRIDPFQVVRGSERPITGVIVGLLANETLWEQDAVLYYRMLEYAQGYEYFAHPALRHTLFLTPTYSNTFLIGYPDGWRATMQADEAIIMPEFTSAAAVPWVRIIPFNSISAEPAGSQDVDEHRATVVRELATAYNLPADQIAEYLYGQDRQSDYLPLLRFQQNGRMGYLRATHFFWVETSAPTEDFAAYDITLRQIAESLQETFILG